MYDLYCCLLPYCETLCTCLLGFPITAKWCCDQNVHVQPSQKAKRRGCCYNRLVSVVLNACYVMNGVCTKNTTYMPLLEPVPSNVFLNGASVRFSDLEVKYLCVFLNALLKGDDDIQRQVKSLCCVIFRDK